MFFLKNKEAFPDFPDLNFRSFTAVSCICYWHWIFLTSSNIHVMGPSKGHNGQRMSERLWAVDVKQDTVDGSEIRLYHQLRLVVYPIIFTGL